MPPSERSKKKKGNQGVTDNPHPGNNNGRRPNTRATTDSGTAPPAPPRLPPQKLSLKSLQQQLNDLQKITTRLADKLDADNVPHTSAVSTTVTTTVSSTGLLGVLPAGSPSVTSAANQGLLQQVTSTITATTSSTIPIYSTNSVFGLQPPALLPTRTDGLGATLASSIMSTGISSYAGNNSAQVRSASVLGDLLANQDMGTRLLEAGVHLPLDTGISDGIKDKIWQDKFVELKQLLPNARPRQQFTVNLDTLAGSPTLTLANSAEDRAKQSLTLSQWSMAFSIYHYIYIQKHLARSPQLIAYAHLIRSLAERGAQWSRYDALFRQLRHASPSTPWDVPNMQLYVDAFSHVKPTSFTTKPNQQQSNNSLPLGYCFRYHSAASNCFAASCPYKHACPTCSGAHKNFNCPRNSQNRNTNPRKR
ncbi:uncharacterized protein LOC144865820 [Branchiostoma floridae x Branchiostoma japonicum]